MIQTFVVSVNWYAIMCEKSKYTSPARTQTSCRWAHGLSHMLTHWGRVTHKCVGNLTIIGPDNGLSPGRRQAIIRTNAGILLMEPLRTNFRWNFNRNSYIFNNENAFESVVWKMAAILSRPQCVKTFVFCMMSDDAEICHGLRVIIDMSTLVEL